MSQLYEYWNSGDGSYTDTYSIYWKGQSFTASLGYILTSIKMKLARVGSPGTCTFEIKLCDAEHKPTGDVLTSGTINGNLLTTNSAGEWYEIALSPQLQLTQGNEYAITIHCEGLNTSNRLLIRRDTEAPIYADGVYLSSSNAGSTWTPNDTLTLLFETYGEPPPEPPTVQTDPASGISYDQATLHGTLTDDGGLSCQVRFNYGLTTEYGNNTDWQTGKVTSDQFQQLVDSLEAEKTYHFRAEAQNDEGTDYGEDRQFTTTAAPLPPGKTVKARITHPAIRRVRVIFEDEQIADYDQLSNPEEERLENCLEIPVPTPCTIEVTTLADQVFDFNIPYKS